MPGKGGASYLRDIYKGSRDALHGARHLGRDCAARRRSAGVSKDSHGCVRLPLEFSKLLFGVTMKGATVIIADQHSAPAETVHPGLFFAQSGEESEAIAPGKFEWDPE